MDPLGLFDIFIGGKGDNVSEIVKRYRNGFARKNPKRWASYFQHDSDAIMDAIRRAKKEKACEPINIIGHSYGGDTAAELAAHLGKEGINVDLLVLIDPVGYTRPEIGGNVLKLINAGSFPKKSIGLGLDDSIAFVGGQWNTGYYTPYHHGQFAKMMDYAPTGASSPHDALLYSNCSCQH